MKLSQQNQNQDDQSVSTDHGLPTIASSEDLNEELTTITNKNNKKLKSTHPTTNSNTTTVSNTNDRPKKMVLPGWESDIPSSPDHSVVSNNKNTVIISASTNSTSILIETEDEREEREHREFIDALKKTAATSSQTLGVTAQTKLILKSTSLSSSSATVTTATSASSTAALVNEDNNTITASSSDIKPAATLGRIFESDGDMIDEVDVEEKKKSALELLEEAKRGKELRPVDHNTIEYINIRKNLYIVPRVLAKLTPEEVFTKREDLHIKVRGKQCPAPVDTWDQCGLSERALQILQKLNLEAPFAIQKQCIPAIMCGRDVIAIAKTGSGKTLGE